MARYDVECAACGVQEVCRPMEEAALPFACPECQGEARRLYSPPADHSENTFHPYRSDALSPTPEAVHIKSRAEEKLHMAAMGVERYEKGTVSHNIRTRERLKKERVQAFVDQHRETTIRKLYHAKNYGYAPSRG